jgi:protein tyrosine phosphatase
MEQHLNDKSGIEKDWEGLVNYVPDFIDNDVAKLSINTSKNRFSDILPCENYIQLNVFFFLFKLVILDDHTRIRLKESRENDYINASAIVSDSFSLFNCNLHVYIYI